MATTITLDSLNLADNTNYFALAGWDWGSASIAQVIFNGDYDATQYDNVVAASRITREVVGRLRLKSTTSNGLEDLVQAIHAKLNKASRQVPITLDVLPSGASLHSFFTVYGGSIENIVLDQQAESAFVMYVDLHLICDPFVRGAAQSLTGNANALTPYSFDVTPTAGAEGDVPADVKLAVTVNTTSSLHVSAVMAAVWNEATGSSLPGWYESSSLTLGAIGSTVVDAGAHGGSVVKGTNTITSGSQVVATVSLPTQANGWPYGLPARILAVVRDKQTSAGNRGVTTIAAQVTSAGTSVTGDFTPITPGALNGATPLFTLVDLGVFPMPVGASQATSLAVTLTLLQQSTLGSAAVDYDLVIVVPDSNMVYSEDPTADYTPATTLNITNDNVFQNSTNGQAYAIVTGSHVRFKGPGRVLVAAFSQPAATRGTADVLSMNAATAVTYTPRYIGLAG